MAFFLHYNLALYRVGTEMGSDTGMKYLFDELNEVKEEIANY